MMCWYRLLSSQCGLYCTDDLQVSTLTTQGVVLHSTTRSHWSINEVFDRHMYQTISYQPFFWSVGKWPRRWWGGRRAIVTGVRWRSWRARGSVCAHWLGRVGCRGRRRDRRMWRGADWIGGGGCRTQRVGQRRDVRGDRERCACGEGW